MIFLTIVPLVLHEAYSWIGFNPTDDGFILALSRRILDGQVPHRDFVFIRPAGSPLLHTIWLPLAGDYCLLVSRAFVWFQIAAFSWIWTVLLTGGSRSRWSIPGAGAIALTSLFLHSHYFPIMVWYTFDGIFLTSLGIWSLWRGERLALPGAVFLGCALLCKQNFVLVGILGIALLGYARRPGIWLAFLAPGLAYAGWIVAAGGLTDLMEQVGAQKGLYMYGIRPYLVDPATGWGIVIGLALIHPLLRGELSRRFADRDPTLSDSESLVVLLILGAVVAAHATHVWGGLQFTTWCYLLFGILAALTACDICYGCLDAGQLKIRFLLLFNAWSASVSLSDTSPSMMSGCMMVGFLTRCQVAMIGSRRGIRYGWGFLLAGALFVCGLQHHRWKTWEPYREPPASHLDSSLGDVLRGGQGILTNRNLWHMFKDLNELVEKLKPERVAVLPDLAAYWMLSDQPNPLPIEWPLDSEMPDLALDRRTNNRIYALRGSTVFILQKYPAESIHLDKPSPWSALYSIHTMIQAWMTKVDETRYFEVYR